MTRQYALAFLRRGMRGVKSCRSYSSHQVCLYSNSSRLLFDSNKSASGNVTFSRYEYPLATEPPEITFTTAREAALKASTKTAADARPLSTSAAPFAEVPSDDANGLTSSQRKDTADQQNEHLATNKAAGRLSLGVLPITSTVPDHVPPNVPSSQLETPQTLITTLDNGIRVVSQETYGQVSTIGVVSSVGSRTESQNQQGITHLLEVMAFGDCEKYSGAQVTTLLQDWGGTRFVTAGREQSLHCIDVLRPATANAMELLQQVLLTPAFLQEETIDATKACEFQALDMPPDLLLGEALQKAAYGADQQLGQAHYYNPNSAPEYISADAVREYWQRQFIQNPQGIVIAGAGIQHDTFVDLASEHFGHLSQGSPVLPVKSVYRGGEQHVAHSPVDGLVRVAVGLEVGGWHSEDLVATCVLQTLLGGGSSFSAGGPGKGMYSRLYRQILNRYGWVESAEAFTAFHDESGLWGISGSSYPHKARDMIQIIVENLARLTLELVSDEELDRARNMLKCNVLTQLESRLVLFEDLGRQVLTYGKRENMHATCEKIDAVSKEDLQALARVALSNPPCIAAVGDDLTQVPRKDEIMGWLR